MAALHAAAGIVTLVAAGILALGGAIAVWRDRWHGTVRLAALGAVGVFAIQALIGLALLATAGGLRDGLHLVYALALVAVTPFALSFASAAPPRARSGVLAASGVVALLLAWRLLATG
ncbi:MAG TPA: hypothetical protein VHK63_04755 [Candidatus Limnocylindria bacterium]|nr:hypothetical protein [Candidatus Limnocylindria bacterium]